MNLKKRKRIRFLILMLVLCFLFLLALTRLRIFPLVEEMAVSRVTNEASNIINDAIDEQIRSDQISYDNMVYLEKDSSGNVTALKTNMSEINRLKTQVLELVNDEIMELAVDQIGIPLGNIFFPELLSGRGYSLPVKVMSIRSSDADFENQFTQAGINQTLHQIIMNVGIKMTILTPAGTKNVETSSQVVIAETIIVGNVPSSYVTLDPGFAQVTAYRIQK